MSSARKFLKKAFTPVTILLVPHSNTRQISLKVPSIGIILSVIMWFIGSIYVITIAVNAFEYQRMKENVKYYSGQFIELRNTIHSLKKAESEFNKIFSLGSKHKVLENFNPSDSGSLDMEALRGQIKNSVETVKEINDYLRRQRDLYMATPKGWPVIGRITSTYGGRENPIHGGNDFHSGIDIAVPTGSPVKATADGVVSFSGWNGGSGYLVVIEHGFDFSTYYAHNKDNKVRVGQEVKRGEIIAYAGSTGNSTGPHSHYEIWRNGRHINPKPYIEEKE